MNDSKRQDVLNAAERLFSTHGYANVGIDRIIAESGVARMTVYKHFGGKDGLIQEVLKRRDIFFIENLTKYINNLPENKNERAKIKAVFEWHKNWFLSDGFHGCMFIKASEEFGINYADILNISKKHKESIVNIFFELLSGDHGGQARNKAILLFIILEGLIVNVNMFNSLDFMEIVLNSIDLILRGN